MSVFQIDSYELIPFDITVKPIMDNYLSQLSLDTSDYTFAANYLWLSGGSGFYSIINDTFCFFILTNGELSMLLPPIGEKSNVIEAMNTCFELMAKNNSDSRYTKIDYVDEVLLTSFIAEANIDTHIDPAENYYFHEDYLIEKALVDYVYDADDLISLKGNNYANKRNEINKFKKTYPDFRTEVFTVEEHGEAVLALVNHWISTRMKYMPNENMDGFLDGIYAERIATKRMIKHYNELNLIGLVIFIDDQLVGFTVGEKINTSTASVIIEKTDFEVLGCAQFIFREFAKMLQESYQIELINVGDDMGFENLKRVKMSYHPKKLIPKYTIYQRQ